MQSTQIDMQRKILPHKAVYVAQYCLILWLKTFDQVGENIGKSLYAADEVRGRDIEYVRKKMQHAIGKVEQWANE